MDILLKYIWIVFPKILEMLFKIFWRSISINMCYHFNMLFHYFEIWIIINKSLVIHVLNRGKYIWQQKCIIISTDNKKSAEVQKHHQACKKRQQFRKNSSRIAKTPARFFSHAHSSQCLDGSSWFFLQSCGGFFAILLVFMQSCWCFFQY